MEKQLILKLADGTFQRGFPIVNISMVVSADRQDSVLLIEDCLNTASDIPQLYQKWFIKYQESVNKASEEKFKQGQVTNKSDNSDDNNIPDNSNRGGFKKGQVTNVSSDVDAELKTRLNQWLSPLKEQLNRQNQLKFNFQDEVLFIINTALVNEQNTKDILEKLPWQLWDLFPENCQVEIALNLQDNEPLLTSISEPESPRQIKILGILGDTTNIKVNEDRYALRNLPGARTPIFLEQPTRADFNTLWDDRWDILCFSGHSESTEQGGLLYINPTDKLEITEIRNALRTAVRQGLQLVIFNSCDGLGLARALSDLNIPQMIIWREPVPDEIAQRFLYLFIKSFSSGKSLAVSVREAKEQLKLQFEQIYPNVSWLPIIIQSSFQKNLTWEKLRGKHTQGIQNDLDRMKVLNQIKTDYLENQLNNRLQNQVMLDIGLEKRLNLVQKSTNIETPEQEIIPLSSTTKVIDVLEKRQTLLILGQPGAGKTMTLLDLTSDLVELAEYNSSYPVPVVLELASWTEKQTIADWIVKKLTKDYSISQKVSQQWVKGEKILLLLDGLDEVNESMRALCIQAINDFILEYTYTKIVICSRLQEYEILAQNIRLNCQEVVYLKSLKLEQIEEYLYRPNLTNLKTIIQDNPALLELAKTPLTLNIISIAYEGLSEEDISLSISSVEQDGQIEQERLKEHLFDTYINRMFDRKNIPLKTRGKYKHWLSWLAKYMQENSQNMFYLDRLQQDLETRRIKESKIRKQYDENISIINKTINFGGIVFFLISALSGKIVISIVLSLLFIVINKFYLLSFYHHSILEQQLSKGKRLEIELFEKYIWSGQNALSEFKQTLAFCSGSFFVNFIVSLSAGLLVGGSLMGENNLMLAEEFAEEFLTFLILSVTLIPLLALLNGVIGGITNESKIETRKSSNQGIWYSAKNASLLFIAVVIIIELLSLGSVPFIFTLGIAFYVAMIKGGYSCFQHLMLRVSFYQKGYMPWNYANFLNKATKLIFLEKNNYGYKFIHRLLQEHFITSVSKPLAVNIQNPLSNRAINYRDQVLHKVTAEVQRLLSNLPHNKVVNNSPESASKQIKQPWDIKLTIGNASPVKPNTDAIHVFNYPKIDGKLLILGDRGSGKTTTLLQIIEPLIELARNDYSKAIPVLLNFNFWINSNQTFAEWITDELKSKYEISERISRNWLVEQNLSLFLDGLDWLNTQQQKQCIEAINTFIKVYQPKNLVICCTKDAYEFCNTPLNLNGIIDIKPLNNNQIENYLNQLNCSELWQLIQTNSDLLEWSKNPFSLSIMAVNYREKSLQENDNFLDSCIELMIEQEVNQPWYNSSTGNLSKGQFNNWLSWVAKRLAKDNKTEFFIENIQPNCLNKNQYRLYQIGVGLIVGLLVGLMSGISERLSEGLIAGSIEWRLTPIMIGLIMGLFQGLIEGGLTALCFGLIGGLTKSWKSGLIWGLTLGLTLGLIEGLMGVRENLIIALGLGLSVGLTYGLICSLWKRIRIVETIKWSWLNARKGMIYGLIYGIITGIILAFSSGFSEGFAQGIISVGIIFGVCLFIAILNGIFSGVMGGLIGGLIGSKLKKKTVPNQGIWKSLVNSVIFTLIIGVIAGVVWGVIGSIYGYFLYLPNSDLLLLRGDYGLISAIGVGLGLGVSSSIFSGLIAGLVPGMACIQHFVLRLVLYINRIAPWNYSQFLNYATEKKILRRKGGSYQFLNPELQNYFCTLIINHKD